jgi:hypothetical protein
MRVRAGERLFEAVSALQPEQGAKVTGMCLEMPEAQLLHLLAQPAALAAKVDEAMRVLSAAGYHAAAPAPPPAAALVEVNGTSSPPVGEDDAPSPVPEEPPSPPGASPAPDEAHANPSAPPTPALQALHLDDAAASNSRSSPEPASEHDDE